jgi:hypothetical protein
MQIHYPEPSKLYGLFVAIIAVGVGFLWLELQQILQNAQRYAR